MIPETGQRFGPYEILDELGVGGMGLVFRAWDDRLRREVALKLLHTDYETPGMRQRFLIEARAASSLNHPNICTIFDIGEQGGEPYFVMELLEGITLRDKIARGAVPTEEIVIYARDVAEALACAHSKGIVHRDIKPANIFLVDQPNGRSQTKVLDFGLAKVGMRDGRGSRADLTSTGSTVGTLAYMSPEQARGETLDARSDLFSLGVVMYEMATRRVPFRGTTSAVVFVQLLNHAPEPMREWNDTIPRSLERIVLKLLAKDRGGRFQSATELSEALRKLELKEDGRQKKNHRPAVPLVLAQDPVARIPRTLRKPNAAGHEPRGEAKLDRVTTAPGWNEEAAHHGEAGIDTTPDHIRPRRMPHKESGPRESAFHLRAAAEPETPVRKERLSAAIPPPDSNECRVHVATLDPKSDPRRTRQPARSSSGVTPAALIAEEGSGETLSLSALVRIPEREHVGGSPLRIRFRWLWLTLCLVAAVVASILLLRNNRLRGTSLRDGDAVLLTPVQNRTGDPALGTALDTALELQLRQSTGLSLRGLRDFRRSQREAGDGALTARSVAQRLKAKAYLSSDLQEKDGRYTIRLDLLNAATNDQMAEVRETSPSRAELVSAIGRAATAMRRSLGERPSEIVTHNLPAGRQITSDLDALSAYADGLVGEEQGDERRAVAAYRRSAELDSHFILAELRLAWIYDAGFAELAAEDVARKAENNAAGAGNRIRLLAEVSSHLLVTREPAKALGVARQLLAEYPNDPESSLALARAMRFGGHMAEALLAAQHAMEQDPSNGDAVREAERALIGLDRYDGAIALQAKSDDPRGGGGFSVAADFLGKASLPETGARDHRDDAQRAFSEGAALDSGGNLSAGAGVWRAAARAIAAEDPQRRSASAFLLAHAALDRSLAGRCQDALAFVTEAGMYPKGKAATFEAAMAEALCGDLPKAGAAADQLAEASTPHDTVSEYYVPSLRAALALRGDDALHAVQLLSGLQQQRDEPPLAQYLGGLAHLGAGQNGLARDDFSQVTSHHGYAFLTSAISYPMSFLGLARAEATPESRQESRTNFARFLDLWKGAGIGDPLMVEAEAGSHPKPTLALAPTRPRLH